jgi:hypothetical protein
VSEITRRITDLKIRRQGEFAAMPRSEGVNELESSATPLLAPQQGCDRANSLACCLGSVSIDTLRPDAGA